MKIIVTEEQIKEIINNVYDNYIIKDVSKPKKYRNVLSEEVIKPPNDENAYKREGSIFTMQKLVKINNQIVNLNGFKLQTRLQ
jgi:hypothetical protein